jgi:uncharacterized membrane protein YgaE (UPF0421/DUF939 family)
VNDQILTRGDRVRELFRGRFRDSTSRWRESAFTLGRAALAAPLAYFISQHLWGHQSPFFAAIAAFVIIGVNGREKKVRKVGEMACGVMVGVLLGELARTLIGSGVWQIAVVLFFAGSFARLIDTGIMFAFQCSIQSLLIMIMPPTPSMTPSSRILDALTGVTVSIVIYLVFSEDARKAQRRAADSFYQALENTLNQLALTARSGDVVVGRAALSEVRKVSQDLADEWEVANKAADEMSTYSPTNMRHTSEVQRLQHLLVGSDRAMRNLRVIARREVEYLEVVQAPHSHLADALLACTDAVAELRRAVHSKEVDFTSTRRSLRLFTSYLTPELLLKNDQGLQLGRAGHFEGITLVIQLRSLAVDLLQATGLKNSEAEKFLPSLLITTDDNTIGPRALTQEMRAVEPPATTAALELLITDRSDPDRRPRAATVPTPVVDPTASTDQDDTGRDRVGRDDTGPEVAGSEQGTDRRGGNPPSADGPASGVH